MILGRFVFIISILQFQLLNSLEEVEFIAKYHHDSAIDANFHFNLTLAHRQLQNVLDHLVQVDINLVGFSKLL